VVIKKILKLKEPEGVLRSGQAEPKVVASENRSGAYFLYVSTGSAGSRHLQAGLT
jgi:hypothetical protein